MIYDTAIIGAGWAGLAAALILAPEQKIVLIEAGRDAGGRAKSAQLLDDHLDAGQHLLIGAYQQTLQLLQSLGSHSDYQRLPLQLHLESTTAPPLRLTPPKIAAPLHLLLAIMNAQGVSRRERWRLIQGSLHLVNHRHSAKLTVAELLESLNQPQSLRQRFWSPLCLATLNTPIESASATLFSTVLKQSFSHSHRHSDLILPQQNLTQLFVTPALYRLRQLRQHIMLSQRIESIQPHHGTFLLQSHHRTIHARELIIATAPWHLPPLLRYLPPLQPLGQQLAKWPVHAIATLYLRYPPQIELSYPFIGLLEGPAEWLFDRRFNGQRGVMAAVISHPTATTERQRLLQQTLQQLQHHFPHWPTPLKTTLVVEKRATWAATPEVEAERPNNRSAVERLWLAGDYTQGPYPATLEGAVRSGVETAQQILHNSGH